MKKELGVIRSLGPFLRPYRWAFPAVVALGVLASIAEGIGVSLFIPLLRALEGANEGGLMGGSFTRWTEAMFEGFTVAERVRVISIGIFACIFLKSILVFGNGVLYRWLEARIGHRLRAQIFRRMLTAPVSYLDSLSMGKLMNVLSTESWRVSDAAANLAGLLIAGCTIAVYGVLLWLLSWKLTLLLGGGMLLISLAVSLAAKRARVLGRRVTARNADLAESMVEGLEGMKVIRAFGREEDEFARFDQRSREVGNLILKGQILGAGVGPMYELLATGFLAALLIGTAGAPGGLPAILVFIFMLYRLQPRVMALESARVNLVSLSGAVEEVTSFLKESETGLEKGKRGVGRFPGLRREIRFEGVTFRYATREEPALRGITIRIPAGKTTALAGRSGAGKSTLAHLLLRFYEPTEGEIFADDTPLREIPARVWRERIALVSQDIFLFNTSAEENIRFARKGATRAEVERAAELAHAAEFIRDLPRGYDTLVGDKGVMLSGGQKQRLSLARAILRDPEILILDEATNALDNLSEELIQKALGEFCRNRTVITIAHRLSTMEKADHIVVLSEGVVREEGALRHLMRLDASFARLYELETSRRHAYGT